MPCWLCFFTSWTLVSRNFHMVYACLLQQSLQVANYIFIVVSLHSAMKDGGIHHFFMPQRIKLFSLALAELERKLKARGHHL